MSLLDFPDKLGMERVVRKFVFFEKLEGHSKWLCFSWVHQRSVRDLACQWRKYRWIDVSWANRKEDRNVLSGWHKSPSH